MFNTRFQYANANRVNEFLVIGGDLDNATELALHQAVELVEVAGVTQVVDARLEAEETLWSRFPGISYHWDGIDDAGQRVPSVWFERITDVAHLAIAGGGRVFAHCHMGINRSPSAGFAILLREGLDPFAAISAIRAARPQAVVAYAEDALEWHLARTNASSALRQTERTRLADWRNANPLSMTRALHLGASRTRGTAA